MLMWTGITLSSNMEKLYERIINNSIIKGVEESEAHVSGQRKAATDHILSLKDILKDAQNKWKLLTQPSLM